jgi:exopolysaccharide production protein ExoZ
MREVHPNMKRDVSYSERGDNRWSIYRLAEERPLRAQFVGMDILRAIAAMMILLFHAHSIAERQAFSRDYKIFSTPNFWYACIELFFVMSGFLMVHMSYEMYGQPGAWKAFLIRRVVRTPPLYYAYTIVVFSLFLILPNLTDIPVTFARFINSLLFIPSSNPPIITIGWTLNYEVYFYILVGVGLFLRFPFGPMLTAGILVTAAILGQIYMPQVEPFRLWTANILLDFVIGIIVAVMYYRNFALGFCLRWLLFFSALVLLSLPIDVDDGTLARPLVFGTAVGLIVAVLTLRQSQPRFGAIETPLVNLGARAYTIYLSHILILKLVEKVLFRYWQGPTAAYAYIVVGAVTVLIVSAVLYEVVERPLTKILQAWAKRQGSYSIR